MSFAYTTHILLFAFPLRTGDITSNKRTLPIHFPDAVSINFTVSKGRMSIYYCRSNRAKIFRVIINSLAPWFLGPYLISAKLECMQIICSNTMCSQLAIIRIRWSVSGNFNKRVSFLLLCTKLPICIGIGIFTRITLSIQFTSSQSFLAVAFYHQNSESIRNVLTNLRFGKLNSYCGDITANTLKQESADYPLMNWIQN